MTMRKRVVYFFIAVFLLVAASFLLWRFLLSAPDKFPSGAIVSVEKGTGLKRISFGLKKSGIVRSGSFFLFFVKLTGGSNELKYGDYVFNEPISVFGVAKKITKGDFGVKPVKKIILEGSSAKEILEILKDFENFDADVFLNTAKELEGYFFPDTYFFLPGATTEEMIETMKENFKNKAGTVGKEDMTMASLIEKESPPGKDRKIISGILWKRIDIGMPLQVDAVFPYITGKKGEKVTLDDLKIKSPYNTYLNKGLPPGPIGNPGLDAIDASLNPEESPYLYYLHGKDGKIRFAKTFAEHLRNKEKYLK